MIKKDLVSRVAALSGADVNTVSLMVTAINDVIRESLLSGEGLTMSGFGAFSVIDTKQRTARNPKTNETVIVPAGKKIKFKPFFKIKING